MNQQTTPMTTPMNTPCRSKCNACCCSSANCSPSFYTPTSSLARGCNICSKLKDTSRCPYSVVDMPYSLSYYNKPTRKSTTNTDRTLIMVFTIMAILVFLIMTYFGAIFYLGVRNLEKN